MQWHNIKNIKEKTCQVTWCYRVSHRKLETFKIHFFSFNYHARPLLAFKIVTSLEFTSYLLQLYQNFASFHKFFTVQCVFFLLSNLSFNKETKKNLAKNLPMCDKDATVGNIEYIVSSFFFSIKKSPHDISLKKSLTDRQHSIKCSKKVHKAVFSLVTFRFLKRQLKNFTGWVQTFFTFSSFFFAINFLYEKR